MILFTKISERLTTDQKIVVIVAAVLMAVIVLGFMAVDIWRERPWGDDQ